MHDDQHGTAIITLAAVLNGLEIVKKNIGDVKIVMNGAGAASLSIHKLLCLSGTKKENFIVCDTQGVIYEGRPDLPKNPYKQRVAVETSKRTLEEACENVDIFLGLSAGGALKKEMAAKLCDYPLVFAMANPVPEISLEDLKLVKNNFIYGTGRSDYPNQINNVLAFPYIFRGALDTNSSTISDNMKLAAAKALSDLAKADVPEYINNLYHQELKYGPDYIIPKPFDYRLGYYVSLAVAKSALDNGLSRFQ